ncbi:MAG: hypothetical protein NTV81_00150 [Candidatus Komeilibacteria bacterium]|nr:hypothetical protein [Candidatus Komeilibacteria bacterium]
MRYQKFFISQILISLVLLASCSLVFAEPADPNANTQNTTFKTFAQQSGFTKELTDKPMSPLAIITSVIKIALGFLGVIFLVLIIISGFKWMTTNNPEEIKKIKAKIINAIIGLLIAFAAYGLTTFISGAIFSSLEVPNA